MTQPFSTKIGIIGGGQLGKMLIESAKPWNVEFNILEASKDCPCFEYASTFIEGSLMDDEKIKELAAISDVITYEIEHVGVETLKFLEQNGTAVIRAYKNNFTKTTALLRRRSLSSIPLKLLNWI